MKKAIASGFLVILFALAAIPQAPSSAYGEGYAYLGTKLGTRIKQISGKNYELSDARTDFSPTENILIMTRFWNIFGIENFRFRYELRGLDNNINRTQFSQLFQPRLANWPETMATWNSLGGLPAGRYEYQVKIAINGGAMTRHLETRQFNVTTGFVFTENNPNIVYSWTEGGDSVRQVSGFIFETINPKTSFSDTQNIFMLTRLGQIRNINNFVIRQEIFTSNGALVKSSISPVRQPNGNIWDYNYFHTDFGRLNVGNYQIRVSVSADGGAWQQLDARNFTVTRSGSGAVLPNNPVIIPNSGTGTTLPIFGNSAIIPRIGNSGSSGLLPGGTRIGNSSINNSHIFDDRLFGNRTSLFDDNSFFSRFTSNSSSLSSSDSLSGSMRIIPHR